MWEVEKKSEKRKVRLNENSIIKHFLKNQAQANIYACMPKVFRSTLLVLSLINFIHIFMTLKYFVKNEVIFIVSLVQKKIIVLISIRYWC